MKYTKQERLKIGEKIFKGEHTLYTAALEYDLDYYTARMYFRMYKAVVVNMLTTSSAEQASRYNKMTKKELAEELLKQTASNKSKVNCI